MRTRAKTRARKVRALSPSLWNPAMLERILDKISGKRVLVVGDVGVDRYVMGVVERISPEAPVPIVFVQEETLKLGLAANVADNVHALGGIPLLVGVVGNDRNSQDLSSLLSKIGIQDSHLILDRSRRTVLKERIVSESQQLLRVDYESLHELAPEVKGRVLRKVKSLVGRADAIILQDYAKGLVSPALASGVFAVARRFKKRVAVDPNSKTPMEVYRGAFVLTPNTREAERLSGVAIRSKASLIEAGNRILKGTQAEHVVITRGKEGMAIFSSGSPTVGLIPTFAREVYDVSGAGDTVIAVLTLALAAGASVEEAAVLGNIAAGVEVGKRGTATVSPEEIRASLVGMNERF